MGLTPEKGSPAVRPLYLFKGVLRLKTDYVKTDYDKWREYETEKQKLREQCLMPEEYELAIQRLAEELGV